MLTSVSEGTSMHRLGCLARVAGVGGVISAASLLSHRQEQARDSEQERKQQLQALSLRPGLHRPLVTPVSASWADNVSEEQEHEVGETELEMMVESVAKPNELSKQQAQAEKLKFAINKVLSANIHQVHFSFVSRRPEIWSGAKCTRVELREWWWLSLLMER